MILENFVDFERLKSNPKSILFFKIFVLLSLKTPKLQESCKLDDFYENLHVLDKKYKSQKRIFKLETSKKIETFLLGNVYNTILKQKSDRNITKQEKLQAF